LDDLINIVSVVGDDDDDDDDDGFLFISNLKLTSAIVRELNYNSFASWS
jgi:hypothetical protein